MEALPYVNTAGSLGLIKDIILSKTISENTLNDWMTTLAFIPNPDISMMESFLIILREKPFSPNIALSVASLTHTYCSLNSDCERTTAVFSIIEYFQNNLLKFLGETTSDREVQDKVSFLINL